MLPFSLAKKLPDGLHINPFDVYILQPKNTIDELKETIDSIGYYISPVASIFNLKFLAEEDFFEDEDYQFRKIFENKNIFARVMMSREWSQRSIPLEIGWIDLYNNDKTRLLKDIFGFIYQLCKSDIDQINQVIFDTEFQGEEETMAERLRFLYEILYTFEELFNYLRENIGNSFFRLRNPRNKVPRFREYNPAYLYDDFEGALKRLKEISGGIQSLPFKASLVGFDIPGNNVYNDPDLTIEIKEKMPGTSLPGLVITTRGQEITMNQGSTEGIFLYACVLLRHYHGSSFSKQELDLFFRRLKNYCVEIKTDDYFDPFFGNDIEINESKMPSDLKAQYDWIKEVYKALFRRELRKRDYGKNFTYVNGKEFEKWIYNIMFMDSRDPFIQASSNIRSRIRKELELKGLSSVYDQVSLLSKPASNGIKRYRLDIRPDNIKFPQNERWEKLKSYNPLCDTHESNISE